MKDPNETPAQEKAEVSCVDPLLNEVLNPATTESDEPGTGSE